MQNLPSNIEVSQAQLPQAYEHAKTALAQCASIDECVEWTDKWTALCTYARMSDDETLLKTAMRIKARAIRRTGELMLLFKSPGARTDQPLYPEGKRLDEPTTMTDAATKAGLSEKQRNTAVSAAKIPEDQFEEMVESDTPPTNDKLLKFNQFMQSPKPEGYKEAIALGGTLRRFAEWCDKTSPHIVANGVQEHELDKFRSYVRIVDTWLDQFIVKIGE